MALNGAVLRVGLTSTNGVYSLRSRYEYVLFQLIYFIRYNCETFLKVEAIVVEILQLFPQQRASYSGAVRRH